MTIAGLNGQMSALPLSSLHQNDKIRYAFPEPTKLGAVSIPTGASVMARVDKDSQGNLGVFTDEPLTAGNEVIPKDVKLPLDLNKGYEKLPDENQKLIVTTALEPFALYVKVSLYAAIRIVGPVSAVSNLGLCLTGAVSARAKICDSVRGPVLELFLMGAATAYYLIFPPAAKYLLGVGQDFRLLLKADDYFDFIILLMLGMGLVFQMPAITYVLARIGIVTARWMIKVWRVAVIVILVAAAVLSPTNDIPNMLLFAAPMLRALRHLDHRGGDLWAEETDDLTPGITS